jgi:hypothetical protein
MKFGRRGTSQETHDGWRIHCFLQIPPKGVIFFFLHIFNETKRPTTLIGLQCRKPGPEFRGATHPAFTIQTPPPTRMSDRGSMWRRASDHLFSRYLVTVSSSAPLPSPLPFSIHPSLGWGSSSTMDVVSVSAPRSHLGLGLDIQLTLENIKIKS